MSGECGVGVADDDGLVLELLLVGERDRVRVCKRKTVFLKSRSSFLVSRHQPHLPSPPSLLLAVRKRSALAHTTVDGMRKRKRRLAQQQQRRKRGASENRRREGKSPPKKKEKEKKEKEAKSLYYHFSFSLIC